MLLEKTSPQQSCEECFDSKETRKTTGGEINNERPKKTLW